MKDKIGNIYHHNRKSTDVGSKSKMSGWQNAHTKCAIKGVHVPLSYFYTGVALIKSTKARWGCGNEDKKKGGREGKIRIKIATKIQQLLQDSSKITIFFFFSFFSQLNLIHSFFFFFHKKKYF